MIIRKFHLRQMLRLLFLIGILSVMLFLGPKITAQEPEKQYDPTDKESPPPLGQVTEQGLFSTQASLSRVGTSPIDPPEPNDTTFVVDDAGGLDTGCTFRSGGPLIIPLRIDRYIGERDPDGTFSTLVTNKVISAKARMRMPAFDVDSGASLPPPFDPEVDKVFLNDQELSKPLTGNNNQWIMNEFEIPIDIIKFPADRGSSGAKPTAAENIIRIDIDTANVDIGQELWCTAIDWVSLQFEAMAPLLLVHGTNSNPEDTWEPDVTNFLQTRAIPFEARGIRLTPNGSIANNGRILAQQIREQAISFGVQNVHLVAHSKGGLDSRRYLSTHYEPDQVKVLSLHTLSSPHHGTILSDLAVAHRTNRLFTFSQDPTVQAFLDGDDWYLVHFFPRGDATRDQQIANMRQFNFQNAFPSGVKLYTYGADADLDNDGTITIAEADGILPNVPVIFPAAERGTVMYRALRDISSITVIRRPRRFLSARWEIVPNATTSSQDNDIVVTDTSSRHPSQIQHFGPLDRNHGTIKDDTTMTSVLSRIQADFPVR